MRLTVRWEMGDRGLFDRALERPEKRKFLL